MKSKTKKTHQKKPRRRKKRGLRQFHSLCAAAAMTSLGAAPCVSAEGPPESASFRFQYSYYQDWQAGKDERITVRAPMAWLNTAISESTALEASFVFDTVSGASALYHDTLTGASGTQIEDERNAGDVTVTQYFERFSLAVGTNYSSEDDYDSIGGNLTGSFWTEDKNTTFTFGVGGGDDKVRSTNNPLLDESRNNVSLLAGVTRVIDKNSLIQTNLTFSHDSGYLNDPYKLEDRRPSSRSGVAWLTRYIRYIPAASASLHLDYRYYQDNWDIDSHTVEVNWYQPLGEENNWILRPRFRYYTQSKASFYRDFFPPDTDGDLYTADQRLSGFGDVTTGLKLTRAFDDGFAVSLSSDFIYTSSSLKAFSGGSPNIEDLYSTFFSFGIEKRF
jgi:hypothetical protein